MLTRTYEKVLGLLRTFLLQGENGYEKAAGRRGIGRWCASWWFFGLGEALYGEWISGSA
jgi:hypothetical protein